MKLSDMPTTIINWFGQCIDALLCYGKELRREPLKVVFGVAVILLVVIFLIVIFKPTDLQIIPICLAIVVIGVIVTVAILVDGRQQRRDQSIDNEKVTQRRVKRGEAYEKAQQANSDNIIS